MTVLKNPLHNKMNTLVRRVAVLLVVLGAVIPAGSTLAQTTVGPFMFTPTSSSGVLQGQAEIGGTPAEVGDIVGVIDGSGNTAGAAEVIISGGTAFINVTIYGDDTTTPDVDEGMTPGEGFSLQLWDADEGAVLDGPSLSGWTNTNGAPMPGFDDPSTVYTFTPLLQPPVAPVTTSPANGATGVSLPPTLSWTNVSGADTYDVDVSTEAGFGSTVFSEAGLTAAQTTVSGLDLGSDYFWRVRAANAAGTSAWSATGNFTTRQAVVPPAPSLAAPLDGATDVDLDVEFSWSAATDATSYEIQVATDEAFGSVVASMGGLAGTNFAAVLPDHLTQYFWRVQASGSAGTGPWSAVSSFTTVAPDAPVAPSLTSPADGATSVALSPMLMWAPVGDGVTYEIELATDSAFLDVIASDNAIDATLFSASNLEPFTTYFWHVRGTNAGGTGPWSTTRTFETVLPDAPPQVQPALPEDGAENVPPTANFGWAAVDGAASYDVEWATNSAFTDNRVLEEDLTFPPPGDPGDILEFSPPFLAHDVTYFWRVRAKNAGGAGPWSETRSFRTIIAAPGMVVLVSPANGAVDQSSALTLEFQAAPRAAGHDIQLATDAAFSQLVAEAVSLQGTTFDMDGLAPATTYYWRVRGTNVGGIGSWSEARTFVTVVAAPAAPAPLAPQQGDENVESPVPLSWSSVPGAASFLLQVATDNAFSEISVELSVPAATDGQAAPSLLVNGLAPETTYFWRIRAENAGGSSNWSDVWHFTTLVAAPGTVVLFLPADGATQIDLAPTLVWEASPASGTIVYSVEAGTDAAFASDDGLIFSGTVDDTEAVLSGLEFMTTYYWRVRAGNEGGAGPWSAPRSFATRLPPAPSAPGLASPVEGATSVPVTPTLEWNAPALATSYDVQVSTSSQFVPLVFQVSDIESTGIETDSLAFETGHFWRVRAKNAGGVGPWSAPMTFTTMALPPPPPVDLTEPSDKVQDVPASFTLQWTPISIAETYDVQVSLFGALLIDTTGVVGTSMEISGLEPGTEYFWRVRARNMAGTGPWSPSFSFRTALFTGIGGTDHLSGTASELPTRLALESVWPNPFSADATVRIALPLSGPVRVTLVDMLGRRRGVLLERDLPAGRHDVALHAAPFALEGGVYLIRLVKGSDTAIRLITYVP